jgi:hypothetical protein
MSQFVSVKDPRVSISPEQDSLHVIKTGSQRITYSRNTADSYQLNSALVDASWTINPPSNQTLIDRFFRVKYYVEVKCTGADFEPVANDAMRQMPLNSLIDVTSLKLNGEQVSDASGDVLHAQLCYHNESDERRKSWSTTAAQPDQYQALEDYFVLGTARNVAANYGENSLEPSRGSYTYEVVDAQTLRFEITEPIFISPLFQGVGRQCEGLVNINEIVLNLRFKADSQRFMTITPRLAPNPNITSITAQFYRAPEMILAYLTPQMFDGIPAVQTLSYVKPQSYIKQEATPLAAGETRTLITDSIRLSQVPARVMLFCRRTQATSTFDKPDSFLAIKSIRVQWNNEDSLLSSANQGDLYEISRRNGCNQSWVQWSKQRGSVLMLEMGKDIGLPQGLSAGVQGSFTLSCQVEFENVSGADYLPSFYMTLYNQGAFSISQNSARVSTGNLSPSIVLVAQKEGEEVAAHHHAMDTGGSLLSSLASMVPRKHAKAHGSKHAHSHEEKEMSAPSRVVGGSLRRR